MSFVRIFLGLLCAVAALAACSGHATPEYTAALQNPGYGTAPAPDAGLAAALKTATDANKRVLVIFGADWCPDCRKLGADLKVGRLATLAQQDFVVVKVDVGNFDRNLAFTHRFGAPLSEGIPAVAIIDAQDHITHVANARELAAALEQRDAKVIEYFERLKRMSFRG